MSRRVKLALLQTLKSARVFNEVAESRWRSDKLLILCYHGISLDDEHEWKPSFSMTEQEFEGRLAFLRAGGYSVLPLNDALLRLASHRLPDKSVAITFDDGLFNFYSKAWPILRRYGFPVTLYLTTYYAMHNLPVFPLICSYMLWKKRGSVLPALPTLGIDAPIELVSAEGRMTAWKALQNTAEACRWDAVQKNAVARTLADALRLDFDRLSAARLCHLMNPAEIRDIAADGVDIELHAHRHRTPVDQASFQREILENRSAIEHLTGRTPRHYCYPSGVTRPEFLPWLAELGVTSATTCEPGFAESSSNPLLLPRFLDASNVSPIEFKSWLAGVGAWLPRNPYKFLRNYGRAPRYG